MVRILNSKGMTYRTTVQYGEGTLENSLKEKVLFLNENSLLKLLYIGIQNATTKWSMPIRNWILTFSQLIMFFEGRLDESLNM